jgi:Cof subfamily protein (haloacid dehalogenase superfamily)
MITELRLLVADIDGTLVNEPRDMLELTRNCLNTLHQKGVLIGIASGRPLGPQMDALAVGWGLDFQPECMIGMNGGQLKDRLNGQYSEYYKLSRESLKEIITLMRPLDLNPFVYRGEDMLSLRMDSEMKAAMERHNIKCMVCNNESELYSEDTAKILYRGAAERMKEYEAYAERHPSPAYQHFKTQPTMLEFQDPRVNKGVALKAFCQAHDIQLSSVMAFGDMSNDNEMLKCAGWGVCLKNGTADTRACADAVTEYDNNHDGFGHYVQDNVMSLVK